uniref:Titin n=1 Tax=Bubo bubo TaxID=30461 RepID=A0A8C0EKB2_BUBBB
LTKPQNLEVLEGEKAEFFCSVSKEAITVQWLRGDTVLEAGDKYDIISDGKKRTLVVKDSILGDAGKYTVMVGEAKATARLTVIGKLYFINVQVHILLHSLYIAHDFGVFILTEEDLRIIEPLEDIETMEKKTVTFWCKVNRLNATLKWTKNGEEITFNKRILYKIDKYKHSLIIKDCGFVDEGEYTVTAGQDKSVAELLITEAPADFIEHLRDQTVTEFDDAVFTCQLSKEKASVRWYRNGREIKEGKKYQFEKDGNLHRLIIKDCRLDDECEYSCGVDDRKSRARLFVEGMCRLNRISPGADVIFMAELNKDGVEVKWLRNNMIIVQGDKHQMMSEGKVHRLQVCEIKPRDQGEYRFIAKDKEARAKLELAGKLLALSAPRIKTGDQNLVVDVGKPLTMTVPYDAYPRAEAEWLKGEESLPTTTVDTTTDCTTFKIYEAKKSDKGRYKVILRNKHGQAEAFINVEVIDVPGPVRNLEVTETYDGEVATLTWEPPEYDGGSPITGYIIELRNRGSIKWEPTMTTGADELSAVLTDVVENEEYFFRVRAQNMVGVGKPSPATRARPSPPINLDHSDQTKSSVQLTWEPPLKDGGSPILGYIVERQEEGTDKWIRCNPKLVPALTYKVTGLKPGSSYYYRVSAENAAGVSDPAEHLKLLHQIHFSFFPVGPTMDLSAFKDGLEVIVPEPIKIRVPITGYPVPTATWSFGDQVLEEGDRVTMKTTASFAELVITPTVPDPPENVKWRNPTSKGIFLTWEPPKYDGGARIKGYLVEKSQRGTDKWEICGEPVVETKMEVTKLKEGEWYAYRVKALNRIGASKPSKPTDDIQAIDAKEIFLDVKLLAGLTVKAGTKIELPAKVTGKPEPQVTWTKADKILRPDDRITIETKPNHSTVTITDSKRSDSGTYIIEAVNSSGRATAVVEVNVLGMHVFYVYKNH